MEIINSAHLSINDTISEFAAALRTKVNWPDFSGKLTAFSESPNLSRQAVGEKVVSDLVEIADSSSPFFQSYLAYFVQALFAIARAPEVKDGARQIAVEVLLCIIEVEDLRKCLTISEFSSEFVPILLEFKLKAVEDGDWIDHDIAALEADAARVYDVCEDLDRVAINIGKENLEIIFSYISEYLKKDEWQYKLVAAMAIITEILLERLDDLYCSTDTLLDKIIAILMVNLKNQHHHVRSTTCKTIRRVAENYSLFHEKYAKVSLLLVVNMFDDPSPGVQHEAIVAFIYFAREIESEDLMPFADQIVDKLLKCIKPEKSRKMQEQCIRGLELVAYVIGKEFMKYNPVVIPVIVEIIIASSTKEEREIREKAMESFTTIMWALLADADDLEDNDSLKEDIQETFRQMWLTFKKEVRSYLPRLIPNILKDVTTGTQPPAVRLLSTFIKVLGAQFEEYLVPAAQSLLSLLSVPLSYYKKELVLTAIANLFTVARKSSDPATRQMLCLWVEEVVEKVFKNLIPGKIAAGITESQLICAEKNTNGLGNCLRNAGSDVLNAQQVGDICKKVLRLIKGSNQRRAITVTYDLYETYGYDREQDLRLALFKLIGVVMSFHADLYLQTGANLCRKFIQTHLDPNCSPSDRALALYVFANVLEHLKDKSAPLWPTFASRLVECIGNPDPAVRRAAAYGVIQAAKCPQFPAELIQKAAAKLFDLINAKKSRKTAFLLATDSMIAALGTFIVHRKSCLQPSPEQCINLWISNLPLKLDREEGRRTHGDLVDLLVQRSPEVLGPHCVNVPKLAAICASIYERGFKTEKTNEGIRDFMMNVGFAVISSVGATFDEKIQESLKRINRDCQHYELYVLI